MFNRIISTLIFSFYVSLCFSQQQQYPPGYPGITTQVVTAMGLPTSVTIGEPPYLHPSGCELAITRYVSRSIEMMGLYEFISNTNVCYNSNNLPEGTTNCTPPYNKCSGHVNCPQKYAELIKALTDVDAKFIQRAYVGAAGREHQFTPIENHYQVGKQIVDDINFAYDCKGLMRPIIQGMVYESGNPANLAENYEWPLFRNVK